MLVIAVKIMAVNPAAGPLTLKADLLSVPITNPPTMPAINPENKGAPEANAMPKHKGNAIKNTTKPDDKSYLKLEKVFLEKVINFIIYCEKYIDDSICKLDR